jgi:hypothetical protein
LFSQELVSFVVRFKFTYRSFTLFLLQIVLSK